MKIAKQIMKLDVFSLVQNLFKSVERLHLAYKQSVFEAEQHPGDCFLEIMSEIGAR